MQEERASLDKPEIMSGTQSAAKPGSILRFVHRFESCRGGKLLDGLHPREYLGSECGRPALACS